MKTLKSAMLAVLLLLAHPAAEAHKAADSHLRLSRDASGDWRADWLIGLRDLELLVGLDRNADARITWGEVRGARDRIIAATRPLIALRAATSACEIGFGALSIETLSDGAYAEMPLSIACPQQAGPTQLDYALMFDLDAGHRGLVSVDDGAGHTRVEVLSPERRQLALTDEAPGLGATALQFIDEGIWHIWTGYDHLLFLAALIVPIVLGARRGDSPPSLRTAALAIARVVTAFTLAHSLTLLISSLTQVRLPSAPVEAIIALSVALAGANIAFPMFRESSWRIAFAFGLVHGLGFASVFDDLAVAGPLRLLALISFNLGVEIGQLAVVLLGLLPMMLLARVPRLGAATRELSALGISLAGTYWAFERLAPSLIPALSPY